VTGTEVAEERRKIVDMIDRMRNRPARPSTTWRGHLFAVAFGVLLATAVGEVTLRVVRLPIVLETYLFECYATSDEQSRITFRSQILAIPLLKPSFDAGCAWDGYRWHHHTDTFGARNPETWKQVDVVLLGDSMIYGHGLEEEQTSAHFLRQELGRSVSNLGQPGDGPVQYLAKLQNFAVPLHPKVAFVFLFQNDLEDILASRSTAEIARFIETGEGSEARSVPRTQLLNPDLQRSSFLSWKHLKHSFLTWRTVSFLLEKHVRESVRNLAGPDPPTSPPDAEEASVPPLTVREKIAAEYLRAAAKRMQRIARESNIRLVFVFLPACFPNTSRSDRIMRSQARSSAEETGALFLDLLPTLSRGGFRALPGMYLPHDGHLTEQGNRRVAAALAAFVRERHLLDPF
jgi:hypothetical protein